MLFQKTGLIDQLLETDFTARVPKLKVPVYFFSGRYDLTVNIDLAKAYFKKLEAPVKAFYTFEKSAHSPLYEEPERVREILMKDVLNQRTDLSDNSKL